MSDTDRTERDPQADPLVETEAVIATLGRRLQEIERVRQMVRPEDWQTMFRQMGDVLGQLAAHPFLRGDAEAETRLTKMMRASDLEEFDRGVDHLADYVAGKLAFNAALKGKPVDPSALHPTSTAQSRATGMPARASAAHGPSGDDFMVDAPDVADEQTSDTGRDTGGETTVPDRPRRSVLRL
jgi:hypothetical protein